MRVGILSVAAVWLLFAASAQATTISCEPCSAPYQRWTDEAREPLPVAVTVVEDTGPCVLEVMACAEDDTVWISVASRGVFYHELGHLFDADLLPEWGRERFMELFGLEGPWRLSEPLAYGPNELFADVYAQCALRPHLGSHWARRGGVGPIFQEDPIGGTKLHNRVCAMLERF
jgi:hypothetical protein